MLFDNLGPRQVVADFSGGFLSNEGGVLLLRQIDHGLGVTHNLATCFSDFRDARYTEHPLQQMLAQLIYGMALGYEDLNDHNPLRGDPLMAVAVDKLDPLGLDRTHPEDRGKALAAPATLNRLELSNNRSTRYHKLAHDPKKIQACLLTMGVRCLPKHSSEVVLDFDAMGTLLYGMQEGRNFHGYYDDYCYLPLYCFAGDVPLWAQLRPSDCDPLEGVVEALTQIIAAIRRRLPQVRIIVRGDCNFCREELMKCCEDHREVYYCLGFARNERLWEWMQPALAVARGQRCLTGAASERRFAECDYQTDRSWSRARRVVGKAEATAEGHDVRYVVTNLPANGFGDEEESRERFGAQPLYEQLYCGRGQMENVLKQQTLDLKADRASTHWFASNQLRLWLTTFAYLLLERMRALTLVGTDLARATVGTIRVRILKVAAMVCVSVRRVHVRLCSSHVWRLWWERSHERVMGLSWEAG